MGHQAGHSIFFIAALVALSVNPARGEESAASPFVPGETLTYQVTWSIFPAGEVRFALKKIAEGPTDDYEVEATAHSQGFASLLYKVDNEIQSVFDSKTLCSSRISKKVNEGRRHVETQIVFDAGRRLAILEERDLAHPKEPAKHSENEIPACIEDVVSGLYFLRRQSLRVGEQVHVPVNDGSRTYNVTVNVQTREQIQTPLRGTRAAFRVEPRVFGGLIKRKGRMFIWISDDEQRLPLRIKAESTIGSITGNLKSVVEGVNASPALR